MEEKEINQEEKELQEEVQTEEPMVEEPKEEVKEEEPVAEEPKEEVKEEKPVAEEPKEEAKEEEPVAEESKEEVKEEEPVAEEPKEEVKTEEKVETKTEEKEKKKSPVVLWIVLVVVVAACIGAFFVLTKNYEDKKAQELQDTIEENTISTEPLYTLENYPKVDASLATQPLTNAFIKNFTGEDVDVTTLDYTNTHPGYVRLINDEVDLIVVTEPSEEEMALAAEKGVELEVIPVVREGFVFYVNGENPVESLTTDQIQGIYSGEITNWNQVGGEDAEIVPYQRPVNSGSQTGMLSLVMTDKPLMKPLTENLLETMAQIVNYVSSYENGRYSIGYSYFYYATTMFQTIDSTVANNIKLLGINGVKPNNQTIQDGSYPYNTAYYIVINKADDENSASRKLANEMLSKRGQQVAKEAGYVPVK